MSGASELDLLLPSYSVRGELYLGRAVTVASAQFKMEVQP